MIFVGLFKPHLHLRTFSTMVRKNISAALLQLNVGSDRAINLKHAKAKIAEAKGRGAELVALSECFNSPYGTKFFNEYAETIPDGPSSEMLSQAAKQHRIYLVGGTMPERDGPNMYNTCTVWNPDGEMIGKYRKMHLFDIDIPGRITFKESECLSAGNSLCTFNIDDVKIGIGICYDLRFEELAKLYRLQDCSVLIYPAAFNTTTGPLHWELLQRCRAVDNELFVCSISPARGEKGYIAWGYSQVVNPWGKVIANAEHSEEIVYCDLNLSERDEMRQQIPVLSHRRTDIYETVLKKCN